MFVNRTHELAFLTQLLTRERPGPGHLVVLRHWATHCGIPATYWVAERETAAYQRRRFFASLLGIPVEQAPAFATWPDLWQAAAAFLAEKEHILILDELPYAVESDPTILSALQHAWDQHFQQSKVRIFLCGSQIHAMESLLHALGRPLRRRA